MTRHSLSLVGTALAAAALSARCSSDRRGRRWTRAVRRRPAGKIAFLMPDIASTRYELYDSPLFKAQAHEALPRTARSIYNNANA